ncbi:hypothetical protein BOX15_Mlig030707g2 [Macrostomum lignano]|uniref:RGS domain-containing protein n=3 Tax=Macrostomum lignano TaxID=282301 RepID=A0A1I8I5M3_9PLAT|nr:hypothetical protein BOX15_Mlig030707g2 [Macrostomum lignano]
MLYKPGKGKSAKQTGAGKQKFANAQQQSQKQQSTQHQHQHRWHRLSHLLSNIGHLSFFGSQHSLASTSSGGEQVKPDIDEFAPPCRFPQHQLHQHGSQGRSKLAVSCQNLAQMKETLDFDDDWMVGGQLSRDCAAAAAGLEELRRGANRVAKWATGLDHLLADTDGVWVFADFLRTEFSEENIQFWLAVEEFKQLPTDEPGEILAAAHRIERLHIGCEAPASINLDGATEREVQRRLSSGQLDVGMFNAAQSQIFNLMRMDSYARFLKSALYKDCLLCELESRPLPTSAAPHRRSNDSLLQSSMPPVRGSPQKAHASRRHQFGSQERMLDVIRPAADSATSNGTNLKKSDVSSVTLKTYRSREPSFIVAALDLDCGSSVC